MISDIYSSLVYVFNLLSRQVWYVTVVFPSFRIFDQIDVGVQDVSVCGMQIVLLLFFFFFFSISFKKERGVKTNMEDGCSLSKKDV